MLPSFVLQDPAELKDLFLKHTSADANGANFSPLTSDEADKLYSIFKSYHASAKEIDNLKDALRAFERKHCFHNYTRGRDYDGKSSSRYIISFEVQDPIISEHDGIEWIPTHVTGQSFLLNQICKMICMTIDLARQFVFEEASTDVEHLEPMVPTNQPNFNHCADANRRL
jgi:tRNA pseudouridine(38-40) synthase